MQPDGHNIIKYALDSQLCAPVFRLVCQILNSRRIIMLMGKLYFIFPDLSIDKKKQIIVKKT